jgi:hypothetical protein
LLAAEGFAAAKARGEAVGNWKARRLAVADSMLGTDIVAAMIGLDWIGSKEKVRLASQLNAREKSEADWSDECQSTTIPSCHGRHSGKRFFASEAKHLWGKLGLDLDYLHLHLLMGDLWLAASCYRDGVLTHELGVFLINAVYAVGNDEDNIFDDLSDLVCVIQQYIVGHFCNALSRESDSCLGASTI